MAAERRAGEAGAGFLDYEPPALTMHGTVADSTRMMTSGGSTDATFPAGTPVGKLTFS